MTLPPIGDAARAIVDASTAARGSARAWSPLDLLDALAGDEGGAGALAALRVDLPALRGRLERALASRAGTRRRGRGAARNGAVPDAARLVLAAAEEAALAGAGEVEVEHLLLALAEDAEAAAILRELGVTRAAVRGRYDAVQRRLLRARLPLSSYRALSAFGRDLTEEARRGALDPVIGRDGEMRRLMQILNRRMKNTPVLVGHAGVGKTAIVEGLAARIAGGRVPERLKYTRIVAVEMAALVAGTGARGQFEERLRGMIEEVGRAEGEILLFVDEVHTIAGAGASEGGFDFAGIVKPVLARGGLRLIGATTPDEYRRFIERDAALERRLTPVWVAEPSPGESVAILHGLRSRFEEHHAVRIRDDALAAAVRLSARYLSGRSLPDKAIDLVDEAASRTALARGTMPEELAALDLRLREGELEATSDGTAIETARGEHRGRLLAWLDARGEPPAVAEAEVAALVAEMTGIPVSRMLEGEGARLLRLEERLHRRVVGQDEAVTLLAQAIRRARAGLGDPRRPLGSFIFLGPSGVGKTELARALAEALFDDPEALLRLDMSEYMERHNVARLFGAPPGYVGYDDGGALTEQVRQRPYRVILFDEIEKAHADVFNVLLQILDAGRMTDGHGRVVDFRNTVLIMTSNLGTGDERDAAHLLKREGEKYDRTWLEVRVAEALRATFRPEFRNRIDEIVVFEPLSERELHAIVDLHLAELRAALALRGVTLELTARARAALAREGFEPAFGARPLRRTIQRRLMNPVAVRLLRDDVTPGSALAFGLRDGRYMLTLRRGAEPVAPVAPPAQTTAGSEGRKSAPSRGRPNGRMRRPPPGVEQTVAVPPAFLI